MRYLIKRRLWWLLTPRQMPIDVFIVSPVSMDRWAPQARRKCLRFPQLSANQFSIKSQFGSFAARTMKLCVYTERKRFHNDFLGWKSSASLFAPAPLTIPWKKRRNFLKILRRKNIRFNAKQLIMSECLLMFLSSLGYVCVCVLVFVEIMSFSRVINNAREREQRFLICFSPPFYLKPLPGRLLERSLKKHF